MGTVIMIDVSDEPRARLVGRQLQKSKKQPPSSALVVPPLSDKFIRPSKPLLWSLSVASWGALGYPRLPRILEQNIDEYAEPTMGHVKSSDLHIHSLQH